MILHQTCSKNFLYLQYFNIYSYIISPAVFTPKRCFFGSWDQTGPSWKCHLSTRYGPGYTLTGNHSEKKVAKLITRGRAGPRPINLTACRCKTGCKSSKCGCRKLGIKCIPACGTYHGTDCTNADIENEDTDAEENEDEDETDTDWDILLTILVWDWLFTSYHNIATWDARHFRHFNQVFNCKWIISSYFFVWAIT